MITSGKHVKKINGKFFKDQEFNLDVNRNGQNKIFLKTQELDNGKRKIYKNVFNSMDDFMRDFNNNNNSLFELNKNIYKPRYITPKYRVRHSPKVRQKKNVEVKKKSVEARKKFVEARKKTIKNKIDKLKKEMKKL